MLHQVSLREWHNEPAYSHGRWSGSNMHWRLKSAYVSHDEWILEVVEVIDP